TFSGTAGVTGTYPLDATGQACAPASTTLTSGTITATYTPTNVCFTASTATDTLTVNAAATTTTVTATPDPAICGEPVTVCATVTNDDVPANTPTGNVTFSGTAGVTGTYPLDATGQACAPASTTLTSGTITATYTPTDACFTASTATDTLTVNAAATTTTVTATPDPSVCGDSVTVCATVTNDDFPGNTPTGNVTFGGTAGVTGTFPLVGGEACAAPSTMLASGTVIATYDPDDACFATSIDTEELTVNPAATSTTITATPNPAVCGDSVTVCATVTGGPSTPTGNVTFGGTAGVTGTYPVDATGQACAPASTTLTSGTITAIYNPTDSCFAPSTATPVDLTVTSAATTTTIDLTPPGPYTCGDSITVCATVANDDVPGNTPTGTVTFGGTAGLMGTYPVDATGQACAPASTALVSGTITATYDPTDACFAASTATDTLTVNAAATTTTISATPNPAICGESVTVCATVTNDDVPGNTPTGNVTFSGTAGVTGTYPVIAGQACAPASTTLDSGTITATYNPTDACFAASTATDTLTVNAAATTTTISATPNPSICGQSVTVCATVTNTGAPGNTPTGNVTFGGTAGVTGTYPVDATGQACAPASTTLTSGTITATYNPTDACFATSTATPVTLTVNAAATTTTLSATPNPSTCGQSVTVCATVANTGVPGNTPTGSVTFGGTAGVTGTYPVVAGQACAPASTALTSGTVTATYNPDTATCFATSTATPLTLTVNPAPTTTTLSATPNPSTCGQSVTVCATVAGGPSTPTGTVTFTEPNGTLHSNVPLTAGQACFTSTTLTNGNLQATYTPDSPCFATSTAAPLAITVNAAATTTTVVATPNPSTCGQSVTVCATVAGGSSTPTGTVTFTGPGVSTTVPLTGGQACFTSSSLSSGTITATYNGAACFATSSGTVNIVSTAVNTTVTAPPAQIRRRTNGQLVIQTMNATLRNSATMAPIAGQTVVFTANAAGGPIVLGSAITNASGVATLAPPTFTVPVSIVSATTYTASFAGAPCVNPSSATATLTFVPVPSVP
ncbi:Ig-like domain repeat protein, partial [Streptomyces sp. HNM0575]|uniref:Ig-like domain repeat protein n=1 Tax=Streptomyces sp. HNM0575 TaxID=2716338 RepID=UPI00145CB4F4